MSGGDDGFVGRWSRRKRAVVQDDTARILPEAAPDPVVAPEPEPAPPALTEEELAALPRVEDLVEGSDIKMFLQAGVPRALRSAALRRAWMLTPAIRDYKNPAVDYAWDYNTPGGVPGDGLAPSPERAAQMLRDLFAPRAPAEAEPDAVVAQDDDAEPAPAQDIAAASEPIVQPTGDASAHDGRPVPRHRHGGALPS